MSTSVAPRAERWRRTAERVRSAHRESIDIVAADGWPLRADVHEPADSAVGVVVLAHAMLSRRAEFERPPGAGLAGLLVERGWRVITFDFRGHGDSAAPPPAITGSPTYDDFIERDLPAVHAFARSRRRRRQPLVLMGHSLGGHAGLAAQGAGLVSFDAVVTAAANVWLRELEPSTARWLAKRCVLEGAAALSRRLGRLPARALRIGDVDAPTACVDAMHRFARTGRWRSADGRRDYLAGLAGVRVPVLQVLSEGDLLGCTPACGARFVARCGGPHQTWRVAVPFTPRGATLVTSPAARATWEEVERWMRRVDPLSASTGC